MTTRHELFQRGEEVRQQFQHGAHSPAGSTATSAVSGVRRLTAEAVFGGIWARPGLDKHYRMLCTLSVLSVLQRLPQLRTYIHSALTMGLSPRTIQEVFVHCALYGGFPTMVNALGVAREVFEQRGITVPDAPLPDYSLEELEAKGRELRQELQGDYGRSGYAASETHLAAELFQIALQYGYGEIWHRPDLDRKERVVCALAVFTVLDCVPQLRGFLHAAVNSGLDKQEIVEVLMQTAPYGGFPRSLNALAIAQEVLGASA
jgi:4-carboxymuconolactone decarboxylase